MGKKHATSTSQVTIPPEVLARYNAVNKRAEETAATPFQKYGTEASDFVAQMNAQQNAGISDINATAGSYQPYMGAANTATMAGMGPAYAQDLNIDKYMSPYIKNVADATGAMMRQQQEQAQSGNLGTAISSGAFGGDRAGIAAANLQQQNQMAYGKTMSDIMNQGYTQALQTAQQQQGVNLEAEQANLARQLQGGSQLAGLGAQAQQLGLQGAQAKIAAGTMQQQTEQAGKDAMIKQFMQEKGYPFQVAQYLANIAMGTGALSGSTTTSTQPVGLFSGLASGGRVDGYADGGGVAGPMSDSQQGMWGEGYVPGGVLPVSQLMTAEAPPVEKEDNNEALMKLASIAMGGAKRGGVIDARHGYATDGAVRDERLLADDVPAPQTLGSLPEASVRPAMSNEQLTGLAGAAIDRATTGVAPNAGSDMRSAAANFARKYNVPEELFLKLVGQESSFNPEARSDAGAIGLAQLMPGTAKELGVDPNEPMQNLEGGAKYLRQMYDRFGSWDRALAAYNGGPGRLSSAVDRATALGGSYLDYMPEETQNYVGGLTGVVASGGRGGQSDGSNENAGIAGGLRLTHDKPYSERTAVGKMFYNPDGTVNKDAILSILSGLGSMASSNSRYLLPALLQGIGGAASTYAGLEKQRGEVTTKNIENADMFQKAYLRAVEYGYAGTPEDYAQSIKYTGPIPLTGGLIGVQGGNGSAMEFMGAPLDPFGRGMNKMISVAGPDGQPTQVMAGQTLGYLKALEIKLSRDVEMGIASPGMLEQVRSAIAGHTGQITTASGETIADPTSRDVRFGAASQASDADTSIQLTKELPAISQGAYEARRNTNELADALSQMPTTGNLSPWISTFGNVATQLGVVDSSDAATGYEKAIKVISSDIESSMSQLGGSVDTSVLANAVMNARPGPNMTSGAIEELLAIRAGIADYQIARSEALNMARKDPKANLAQVDREFAYEHPIEEYVDVRRPQYEGTIGTDEIPEGGEIPEGSTDVDTNGRPIIYRGGRWVLQ